MKYPLKIMVQALICPIKINFFHILKDSTQKKEFDGSGVGLVIVKKE